MKNKINKNKGLNLGVKIGNTTKIELEFFEQRGKLEYRGKSLSEQEREPTINSTHI